MMQKSSVTGGSAGEDRREELVGAIGSWVEDQVRGAGLSGVVLGLSGGVDSAVCAGICRKALGPTGVLAVAMPCRSAPEDLEDAREIARSLDLDLECVVLDDPLEALLSALGTEPGSEDRVRVGNIKARLRMTVLYELAHETQRLVAGTGNYAEYLVGYTTKWGDAACDIMPLGRLFKDEVVGLVEVLGLPDWLRSRQPSAGLWEGQTDEGEMGVTYEQIRNYVESGPQGMDSNVRERIDMLMSSSAHKRDPIPVFEAREWMAGNA